MRKNLDGTRTRSHSQPNSKPSANTDDTHMGSCGQIAKEHNTHPNQIATFSASMQRLLSKLLENRTQALGLHLKRLVELLFNEIGHDSLAIVALVHPSGVCQRRHHHARKLIYIAHLCRSIEVFDCNANAFYLAIASKMLV